jgi:diguanylate cyclase (GGDEF)-like protein
MIGWLLRRSSAWIMCAGIVLAGLVAILNYFSGSEYSVGIFYLVPIFLVSWGVGTWAGLLLCGLCAGLWMSADFASGLQYSSPYVPIWNTMLRLGLLVGTTFMVDRLRNARDIQALLARVDATTGIPNRRAFLEISERECRKTHRNRRPVTIAYIDLDNFKSVNDDLGHAEGDSVLRTVGRVIQENIRQTDVIARLGGDEFALMLPETGLAGAKVLLVKLQSRLANAMEKHNWPVTFSIGCITFARPVSIEEMIGRADSLMYRVKQGGKDAITWVLTGDEEGKGASLEAPEQR